MRALQRNLMLAAVAAFLVPASAQAAMITLPETAMDEIYGQPSFLPAPIDIRFTAPITHVDPALLLIDDATKLATVLSLFGGGPTVYMIFVDDISFCGGVVDTAFVGCASKPGNHMVVESDAMKTALGGILGAHELGHNAGLGHVTAAGNLMKTSLSSSTITLTSSQAAVVLASAIEQFDTEAFISITPVLIVPEPAALMLLLVAGLAVVRRGRRS